MLTSIRSDYYPYTYSKIWQKSHARRKAREQAGAAGHGLFFGRNQPVAHRVANRFGLVLQPEILHDAGTMFLNGPRTDIEALRKAIVLQSQKSLTCPRAHRRH
jgi:hypothetical protein